MGDLHCPATIVIAAAGATTRSRLIDALTGRRIAMVFAPPGGESEQSAAVLASSLGCAMRTEAELEAQNAAETAVDVTRRWSDVVDEIGDRYRGETVLIMTTPDAVGSAIPSLTSVDGVPTPAADAGIMAELECDADGTRAIAWAGPSN